MRIGLITPGFSASEEDWCIPVLLNLVRALSSDHDVHVFTLRYPHRRSPYRVAGATVHPFGGAETRGFGRFLLLQRALRTILREHRSKPFDVLHGLWADEPGLLSALAGRFARVPSVVSVMGGELVALPEIEYGGQLDVVNPRLTRIALRYASRVTVGSVYLQHLAERFVDPDRLQRLPLGVDTDRFRPQVTNETSSSLQTGEPAIINVGSLSPVKGHRTLLEALALLTDEFPGIHLHLIGDGPLRIELQSRADSLGVGDHLTLHGELPHHCLPAYYQAAELFVAASLHESQCLAALEAAACGCPVLGTAVGVLPELSPPSSGIAPGDARALATGIRTLYTSRREMGCRSLSDLVRSEYSLEKMIERLLALYGGLNR